MLKALIDKAAVVGLLVAVIIIFGWKVYEEMPREAAPDVDIPVVLITTPYIGVSAKDIETLITTPIENELTSVKDVKKMSSTSAEGASIISLEFEPEVIIEDALQRVRDRVNRARAKIPDEAEETDIREVSFSDFPILILTLAGPVDDAVLKDLGEDMEERVKRINGVLDAKITGGREREIKVQVDPFRLQHFGLQLQDVVNAISAENVNIPGGDVTTGDAKFLLRVPGEFEVGKEIENVAIKRVGDRPVFVRDVGRIEDEFKERESYARMNGRPAVSIAVTKRTGANILQIADAVKVLAAQQSKTWPEGVNYRIVGDQSKQIRDMVAELENGIITALILVVAVLLFAMGARNSLFVAAAIPLSMLLAIMVLFGFGFTLNMMVLFSLILALGMLVDNAIVIVENIYRHVEMGKTLKEGAIDGTREVAGAVTASTATTVAAFLPLVFWTGIMGQFMGYMPKTVVTVLIASLVVAIVVLPVITGRAMKRTGKKVDESGIPKNAIMRAYQSVLKISIDHRYISATLGVVSLFGTFFAYAVLNHGTEFFPETEPNRATISVRAPDGTDVDATDDIVRQVEAVLVEEENVDFYVAETGVSGGGDPMSGAQSVPHMARITLDFLPDRNTAKEGEKIRVENTTDTIDRLRDKIARIPGAALTIDKERMGPPVGKPIAVEVSGDDFNEVGSIAARVRRELAGIEGTTDLEDDYRVGRPELRLRIDRGAAKRVGADTRTVASTIRTAVAGQIASTIRDGEDEYDIVVNIAPEFRDDLQAVLGLRIPGRLDTSPDTFPVPLSTLASYELAGGSGSIRHIDRKLVVTISGDVAEGYNENAVRAEVMKYIEEAEMPANTFLRLGGANDEQKNAQEFLGNAFLIALFLIAIVLVAQFNRFDLPFIILASVILSLIGVLWGLVLTGTPFGIMMTGLGVISLAGVVVNNAIVLLDYVQQLREQGMATYDALIQAGMTRFRPVILTAITTMLGLIPMALGISFDFRELKWIVGSQSAQFWGPMAVAVIFGLLVATVLTLVMVPTMYSIFEDIRRVLGRAFKRSPAHADDEDHAHDSAGQPSPASH
ncbi:MAG: efflux RND transporter permease subunit [Deltaproteobacteria bacterium]|jgi:multidrug efflux pump